MSAVVPQPSSAQLTVQARSGTTMMAFRNPRDSQFTPPDVADVVAAAAARADVAPPTTLRDGNTRADDSEKRKDNWRWVIKVGMAVVAIVIVIVCWQWFFHVWGNSTTDKTDYNQPVGKPLEGLTVFAVFFVGALALEQLLSPLTRALILVSKQTANIVKANTAWQKSHAAATQAAQNYVFAANLLADSKADSSSAADDDLALRQAETQDKKTASETADQANKDGDLVAAAFDKLTLFQVGRVLTLWTVATVVGILAVVFTHLYFLRQVGISSGLAIDVLVTGLILGGGTAPLSALVTRITAPATTPTT